MTEKVKVPKEYAEWLEGAVLPEGGTPDKAATISTVTDYFRNFRYQDRAYILDFNEWLDENYETAIRAVLDGYEVEEPKQGFRLPEGDYLNNIHLTLGGNVEDELTTTTNRRFYPLPARTIKVAQEYLKGEVVTEDEVNE